MCGCVGPDGYASESASRIARRWSHVTCHTRTPTNASELDEVVVGSNVKYYWEQRTITPKRSDDELEVEVVLEVEADVELTAQAIGSMS